MRTTAALLIAISATIALSSCSGSGGSSATACDDAARAGNASDAVSVVGDFGTVVRVDTPTPLKPKSLERTQLITGTGPVIPRGSVVSIALTALNGTTGEIIQRYDGKTESSAAMGKNLLPGFAKSLECVTVGSRIVSVVPPTDAFGAQGGNAQLKIRADDSLVFVLDVKSASLARANGADQVPTAGFPTIVLDGDGVPGVIVAGKNAPKNLEVETLKKGTGPEVSEGKIVTVQFTAVNWMTRKVIDSSWTTGDPVQWIVADKSKTPRGVVPQLLAALVGQTVGSQFVAQFPTEPSGSAVVYVVDVLAVSS